MDHESRTDIAVPEHPDIEVVIEFTPKDRDLSEAIKQAFAEYEIFESSAFGGQDTFAVFVPALIISLKE